MSVSSELGQDRRAWAASIRAVANSIGDDGSTHSGTSKAIPPTHRNMAPYFPIYFNKFQLPVFCIQSWNERDKINKSPPYLAKQTPVQLHITVQTN